MDFKAINEEVKALLEGGFALSGTAGEVTDLINKLAQEYGDLTIPEFIDKLIEKEKNGEEIVESLNESDDEDITSIALEQIRERIGSSKKKPLVYELKVGITSRRSDCIYTDIGWYCRRAVSFKDLPYTDDIIKEFGFGRHNDAIYAERARGYLEQCINDKSLFGLVEVDFRNNNWHENGITFYYKIYADEDLQDQIDYYFYIIDKICEYINTYYEEEIVPKMRGQIQKAYEDKMSKINKRKEILQQLKQKAEITNKNTTVKQALSKSAVAKKIRELQNPTPEQLAKILAAIEG